MSEKLPGEDKESMGELLKQYRQLLQGKQHFLMEEDDFERVINYFDDADQLPQAMEAANLGLEQFPFSSQLMIKKLICYWLPANTERHWMFWKLRLYTIRPTSTYIY